MKSSDDFKDEVNKLIDSYGGTNAPQEMRVPFASAILSDIIDKYTLNDTQKFKLASMLGNWVNLNAEYFMLSMKDEKLREKGGIISNPGFDYRDTSKNIPDDDETSNNTNNNLDVDFSKSILFATQISLNPFSKIANWPLETKRTMIALGEKFFNSFDDLLIAINKIKIKNSKNLQIAATTNIMLNELNILQNVVRSNLLMITRDTGKLIFLGDKSIEFINNGLFNYGLSISNLGWIPGPTLGSQQISKANWVANKINRIIDGLLAGLYIDENKRIVLPGIQALNDLVDS